MIKKSEKSLKGMIRFETLEGIVQRTILNNNEITFLLGNEAVKTFSDNPYILKDGDEVIVIGVTVNGDYFSALVINNRTTNITVRFYRVAYGYLSMFFMCVAMGMIPVAFSFLNYSVNSIFLLIVLILFLMTIFIRYSGAIGPLFPLSQPKINQMLDYQTVVS
jgi:hypothetical protein